MERTGPWKRRENGSMDGNLMNAVLIMESVQYYKRQKKLVGFKRALPFRYKYILAMWDYAKTLNRIGECSFPDNGTLFAESSSFGEPSPLRAVGETSFLRTLGEPSLIGALGETSPLGEQ